MDIDPNFVIAWVYLGYAYINEAEYEADYTRLETQAWACVNKALQLDQTCGDAHALLGNLHWRRGEFEACLRACERAYKLNSNSANNVVFYATALADTGQIKKALTYMEKALRINPQPAAWYHMLLGNIYLLDQQYESAIVSLQTCIAEAPEIINAHRWLLIAYVEAGLFDEAYTQAEKVLQLNPDFSISKHLKFWLAYEQDPHKRALRAQKLQAVGIPVGSVEIPP